MCPGMKECVAIRNANGKKVYMQKRFLLANLKEIYVSYKDRYPNDNIGFSKFCQLRPKWCVTVTSSGSHSVCVCQQHENMKLIVSALPETLDYKDLLHKIVSSSENKECMMHLCDKCPGKDSLHDYLTELFEAHDQDDDDDISYKQWDQTDRSVLLSLTVSVQEFIFIATDEIDNLRQHHYTANTQAAYIRSLKENVGAQEAVVLLDFAENYSFLVQDAVQGYH